MTVQGKRECQAKVRFKTSLNSFDRKGRGCLQWCMLWAQGRFRDLPFDNSFRIKRERE